MRLADFDYELPERLIAQRPLPERSSSRLLVLGPHGPSERSFAALAALLRPRDLLVLNDTRVIPARLIGAKPSGGRVEILVEEILDAHRVAARARPAKRLAVGATVRFADGAEAQCVGREGERLILTLSEPAEGLLARQGAVPLPPYIQRPAEPEDLGRYQTIYARTPGAVAAPTAGLHFDPPLMQALAERGINHAFVTLHVGSGTFQPVRVEDPRDHRMHSERLEVTPELCAAVDRTRAEGGRVVAVGTTAVRALETAARGGRPRPFSGRTDLFILPGFEFRCVDLLVTNFHLPRSTLLMMVCAFGGRSAVLDAYRYAVAAGMRFFSYGDAMLLERPPRPRDG